MVKLSLSQAAKEAGKSKSRISAAIKNGNLSANRNGNRFEIDPAELFRVFPKNSAKNGSGTGQGASAERAERSEINALQDELKEARAALAASEAIVESQTDNLEDLRRELQRSNEREHKLLAVVGSPAPGPARKGLFARIFGNA